MKKRRSLWQKLRPIMIFSVFGILVLVYLSVVVNAYIQTTQKLDMYYEQAVMGTIAPSYPPVTFVPLTLLVSGIALGIYVILTGVLVVTYRHRLQRRSLSVTQQGRKALVEIKDNRLQGPLIVLGILTLHNDSAGTDLLPEQQLIAVLKDNRLVFDLEILPSGRYSVQKIDFFVRDPLGIYSAGFSRDEVAVVFLLAPVTAPDVSKVNSLAFNEDSPISQFMVDASESYFAMREYQRGDPLKRINWKHSAKYQKLMVRTPEEKPLKQSRLAIVMNLYLPHAEAVNQSVAVGHFLDKVFAAIDLLIEQPFESVDLYINGGLDQEFKEINTYNRNKIHGVLLNPLKGQSQVPLQSFLAQKELSNPLVFTMSSDVPDTKVERVFVFKESAELQKNFAGRVKAGLTARQTGLQFFTMSMLLRELNFIKQGRFQRERKQLLRSIKRNESNLPPDWRFF